MRVALPVLFAVAVVAGSAQGRAQEIQGKGGITLPAPPVIEKHPVSETYQVLNGQPATVNDDYRYLEDAKAPATRAFIATENAYTAKYFDQLKTLPETRTQMAALLRVDVMSTPTRRGDHFFFTLRKAEENQGSIYMRTGLHGADVKLIDGNGRSADGNTSVNLQGLSEDGSVLTYGVRVGGADESEVHFFDVAARKDVGDVLPTARYSGVQMTPDKKGVYYGRFFPHEGTRVYFHAFGTPVDPSTDTLVLGREYHSETLGEIDGIYPRITANGHYLVLSIGRGVPAKREDILLKDLRVADAPIVPLVYGIDNTFAALTVSTKDGQDQFYIETDMGAPNRRILKAEMGVPAAQWKTVIPEGKDVLEGVSIVGGKMFVERLHDVKSELAIYTLDGVKTGEIALPGVGAGSGLSGRPEDQDGFYSFQSIITPPTVFHYDVRTGKSDVFYVQASPFRSAEYELKEVFYTSKDGTRVPMFIAGKKGLKRDGTARLLMTGYGGFAVSETPVWNPEYAWWMEQGGYFALPDLRGGSEYGEAWHKAAMFDKKQNVFDDWYAAAEYLDREKYTSPEHFAIRGRSNGGLLMGASMTQRPELWGAIWCGYPLLDMLRYQRFLMGRTWTTEYGSAEDPSQYSYIAKYSPYQNVKAGTKYPAILFFTGDGDTRVDPMNARKMTPLMQQASSSGRPILLHYSIKGGHSAGVSQTQLVEDYADEMAFLWNETK